MNVPKRLKLKLMVKGLVENYYIIQGTRITMDLREQALCRTEIILHEHTQDGKEKKHIGNILHKDDSEIIIQEKTKKGKLKSVIIPAEDIRKIIPKKFEDVEDARKEIFRFPVGKREADVSSVPLNQMEEDIKRQILRLLKEWPVWSNWLINVKGVGPIIAGGLFAYVDINICEKVSSLWHYAGQHVVDGTIPRLEKGVKRSWNQRLQVIIWNFGETIVRVGDGYRRLYDNRKAKEERNRCFIYNLNDQPEDKTLGFIAGHLLDEPVGKHKVGYFIENKAAAKRILALLNGQGAIRLNRKQAHVNNRAKRFVRKVFLSHVYEVWRKEEGLSVRPVYAIAGGDGVHENISVIRT